MSDLNVALVVQQFKALGLLFSAVRFNDGSLRLFRWKQMTSYENQAAIEALWASCLAESPDKERVIAEFVEATAPNTVPSPSLIPGSQRYRVSALSAWQR